MSSYRLIGFLFSFLLSAPSWADSFLQEPQVFPQWLKVYQFHKGKSRIESQRFFFSEQGMQDPQAELKAAILAFQDTKKLYGTLNLPAACAFPARKELLEKQFQLSFPKVACPDFEEWIKRIDANHMTIDFAGAYSGNPASILGHTFFRYYSDQKNRDGSELLSYAVGFLAVAPPGESRALYMIKGLTGQYPGFFQIEPFYMKVGIYNNSESRDIWEQKLNLTREEVSFSLKLLWEYSFNAQIPYYFIDENCSYRLLSFLEAVRPNVELVTDLSPVVLPADTVRLLLEKGFADPDPQFRSSILRRLNYRVGKFSENQNEQFKNAKKDLRLVKSMDDPQVLDALIDYWTYTNYRVQTNLKKNESEIMEATFLRRSQVKAAGIAIDDQALKTEGDLIPTYLGHKSSWVSLGVGYLEYDDDQAKTYGKVSYRMGAHALSDDPRGYEGIAAIEYLGFDIGSEKDWMLLLIDAKSLESLLSAEKKWSWLADIRVEQKPFEQEPHLILKGGAGAAFQREKVTAYWMPVGKTDLSRKYSELRGGFELGVVINDGNLIGAVTVEHTWGMSGRFRLARMQAEYLLRKDESIFMEFTHMNYAQSLVTLGYKRHF